MRIISQDGKDNIPVEGTSIHLFYQDFTDRGEIYAKLFSSDEELLLGVYSAKGAKEVLDQIGTWMEEVKRSEFFGMEEVSYVSHTFTMPEE